ncbi:MAG: hypothetical protein ABIH49_01745 [archaeon]
MNKKLFLIIAVQIFLVVNLSFANSYLIHQTDLTEAEKSENNFLSSVFEILGEFFSIKQIGIVSAEEGVFCCEKTTEELGGAWCQNVDDDEQCGESFESAPTLCESSSFCQLGTCIENDGLCSAGSPEKKCETDGGIWEKDSIDNINECSLDCCVLGSSSRYTTEANCQLLTDSYGFEQIDYREVGSASECLSVANSITSGACVFDDGSCDFVTGAECPNDASWQRGVLCSAATDSCEKTESTMCYKGEKYYKDNCDNRDEKLPAEEQCTLGQEICKDDSGSAQCVNVNCGEHDNLESWCVYDSPVVGNSKDAVGSSHWRYYCDYGEIKKEECGTYRGEICASVESNSGFSIAQCRTNMWTQCLSINPLNDKSGNLIQDSVDECNEEYDCRVHNVDIDGKFNFSVCVPKYPIGFDLNSVPEEMETISDKISEISCTILQERGFVNFATGGINWKTRDNGNCDSQSFLLKTNELCYSLGDFGAFWNFNEDFVKSFRWESSRPDVTDIDTYYDLNSGNVAPGSGGDDYPNFTRDPAREGNYEDLVEIQEIIAENSGIVENIGTVGVASYAIYTRLAEEGVKFLAALAFEGGPWGASVAAIIAVIAAVIYVVLRALNYGEIRTIDIGFECKPWRAPIGNGDCNACNTGITPCTEYKCQSLGSNCELINERTENNKLCIDTGNDNNPPEILGITTESDYEGCIPESKKVNISFTTDEPAYCKYDSHTIQLNPAENYENVLNDYRYEFAVPENENADFGLMHNATITMPLISNEDVYNFNEAELTGDYSIFFRCVDSGGVFTIDEEKIDLCISSEDISAPDMGAADFVPDDGSYLAYEETSSLLEIRFEEPVDMCKYSLTSGTKYDDMVNEIPCVASGSSSSCNTELTNLQPGENKFYIRCNDTRGNPNNQDFEYNLFVTENPLEIDGLKLSYVVPATGNNEEVVFDLGENPAAKDISVGGDVKFDLEIETSGGADNGNAMCEYQWTSADGNPKWVGLLETNSDYHKQENLILTSGNYNIPVRCRDTVVNENEATANMEFILSNDGDYPLVVRAYKESGKLKLLTSEDAQCVYSWNDDLECGFNFDDGTLMTSAGFDKEHSTGWNEGKTYYVRCRDIWENMKSDGCGIKVSPGIF